MKALIVGAGAVGQVFGYHLARGGAEVTFFVRPKYVDECKRGFTLYPLADKDAVRFEGFGVVTTAAGGGWDQVYLTVSSPALRAGEWIAELARQTGDATIVKLQPGLDDREFLIARMARERIVDGTINFLSYHAPLPGEVRFAEPGMAYWLFPGKGPFSGDDPARVAAVVEALEAGGLPAKAVPDATTLSRFGAAILCTFVAALEAADWSFAAMRAQRTVDLGARAAAEALRVVGGERGAPLAPRLVAHPLVFRTILRVAPHVMPVDLEAYLRAHFTKIADQTHETLGEYVARGKAAGMAVPALAELAGRVLAAPA
ncbi:MAG TPA: 2-dehydropantoate 2-reductase N-terminal domain-containing protein [Kofleriaceae bacterium]|nr:2-dehydropantoate 2-reductase N-terminal domain-containing protein [Kofleriaceae bacterium]